MSDENQENNSVDGATASERSDVHKQNAKRSFSILIQDLGSYIKEVFDFRDDTDYKGSTESIKKNIEFKGSNAWILALSILICSIALNVNSTAVVIGAMLISPIMGPIVGAGLALGTNDFSTLKKSAYSWLTALFIGLITSTVFFYVSPLAEIQSELIARTRPTILDVAIALLGGAAGIISATRPEKGNVIPGVAIATALMPPLCTAGFGLATLNFNFFWGAFYLFFLNSVFICLSTFIGVRYLRYPKVTFVNPRREKLYYRWLLVGLVIIVLPSSYKFVQIWQETLWYTSARNFVSVEFDLVNSNVVSTKYGFHEEWDIFDMIIPSEKEKKEVSTIDVYLIGSQLPQEKLLSIQDQMGTYDLGNTKLLVHQNLSDTTDFDKVTQELKVGIVEDLYNKNDSILKRKGIIVDSLMQRILELEADAYPSSLILEELFAQYPIVEDAGISKLIERNAQGKMDTLMAVTYNCGRKELNKSDKERIENWLKIRLAVDKVKLIRIKE